MLCAAKPIQALSVARRAVGLEHLPTMMPNMAAPAGDMQYNYEIHNAEQYINTAAADEEVRDFVGTCSGGHTAGPLHLWDVALAN